MSKLAVLVPYRSDGGIRDAIHSWTAVRWMHLFPDSGYYIGECDEELPFNRSQAINDAFGYIEDEDIIFITDSDTILDTHIALQAVQYVQHTGKWVIPYWNYCKLDQESSNRLMTQPYDDSIDVNAYSYAEIIRADINDPYRPPLSGGIFMRSEDFRKVGGFDEGFVGWGYEDNAFVKMATHILGPFERLGENIYHLWHPKGTETTWDSPTLGANHYRFHLYNEDIDAMKYDYL